VQACRGSRSSCPAALMPGKEAAIRHRQLDSRQWQVGNAVLLLRLLLHLLLLACCCCGSFVLPLEVRSWAQHMHARVSVCALT
jgi:hypothetical protein